MTKRQVPVLRGALYRSANRVERYSPRLAGMLDHFHREFDQGFGIMNGQEARQRVVEALVQSLKLVDAVETGTFRGTTTEFLARIVPGHVYTVEAQPRRYASNYFRFLWNSRVHVSCGDSREFLRKLAADGMPMPRTLFYLDAHWAEDFPLAEELTIIDQGPWIDPVVIIDDFEVADDPGYQFDDYGPGKRIGPEILPQKVMRERALLLPAIPSAAETGMRRGCGVLVPTSDVPRTLETKTLRLSE
jgi:hypothetical protein